MPSDATNPLAPAGTPATATPEVSRPYSIPPNMTPADASARLAEIKADPAHGAKIIASPDSREAREFDALIAHSIGQRPEVPNQPPTEAERAAAGLGAPDTIEGYDLTNIPTPDGFLRMDEETTTLVNSELLPEAKALDLAQSDVAMIAASVANPCSYDDCETALHRLWPNDEQFAQGHDDFRAAMAGNANARALLKKYPETLGNNPAVIVSVVNAYRRKQGRR